MRRLILDASVQRIFRRNLDWTTDQDAIDSGEPDTAAPGNLTHRPLHRATPFK